MQSTYTMQSKGFTILELMIALAVAAVLMTLAAPSFTASIQNNRMVAQINELNALISVARSEAIKRSSSITLCRSDNGTSCTGNWHDGRIVFVDNNSDGTVDVGDEILSVHGVIPGNSTLTFSDTRVIYGEDGFAIGGSNSTFTLCDSRGATHARGLIVGPSGRQRLAIDSDSNGILEDINNVDLVC